MPGDALWILDEPLVDTLSQFVVTSDTDRFRSDKSTRASDGKDLYASYHNRLY